MLHTPPDLLQMLV